MRKLFLVLLMLLPFFLFAATGDIVSVTIDTLHTTCLAKIEIEGIDTAGTFAFGIDTLGNVDTAKIKFYVQCPGFDDNCDSTTVFDTTYGVTSLRHTYPISTDAQGEPYYTKNGSNAIVWIALSPSIVYSGCHDITVDIDAGFYTNSDANNSVTGMSVTNSSNLEYQKPHANFTHFLWGRLGYDIINNDTISTYTVKAQAYHRDGRYGRPVRAIKIILTDQHSNSISSIATAPEIDTNEVDTIPVQDYIIEFDDISSLTQGDSVRVDLEAYPWIGDTSAVRYSLNSPYTQPHALLTSYHVFNDKDHVLGCVAVVDSATGDDGTGVVVAESAFNPASPPLPFKTIANANDGIVAWNLANLSMDNADGGLQLLKKGSYPWTGSYANNRDGDTYQIIQPFPNVNKSDVIITTNVNDKDLNDKVLIKNLIITESSATFCNGNIDYLDLYNVDRTSPGGNSTFFEKDPGVCTIIGGKTIHGDLTAFSTDQTYYRIRGNTILDTNLSIHPYMMIGNIFKHGCSIRDRKSTDIDFITGGFMAFNKIENLVSGTVLSLYSSDYDQLEGYSIVNNVFEQVDNSVVAFQIAADATDQYTVNNVIVINNTIVGQRGNICYNDYSLNGVGPAPRLYWVFANNLFDNFNIVTDIDAHGDVPGGERYGNHGFYHGNGISGNVFVTNIGVAAELPKFGGIQTYQTGNAYDFLYVDNKSGTGDEVGNGDYHVTSGSIAIGRSFLQYLPYDLDGILRFDGSVYADTMGSTSGAYEYSNFIISSDTLRIDSISPDTGYTLDTLTLYIYAPGLTSIDSLKFGDSIVVPLSFNEDSILLIVPEGLDTGCYDFIVMDSVSIDTLVCGFYHLGLRYTSISLDSIIPTKKDLTFYWTDNGVDTVIVTCSTYSARHSIDTVITIDSLVVSDLCYGVLVNYEIKSTGVDNINDTISTIDRKFTINSFRRVGRPDTIQVAFFLMAKKADSCGSLFKTSLTGTSVTAYSYTNTDTTDLTITTLPYNFGSLWYLKFAKTEYNIDPTDTIMEFYINANEIEQSNITRIIHGE